MMKHLRRRLRFQWKYFRNPPWDTGISPPELMGFIARHPPGRALDLGCGTGTNGITLAQHGWQVTGIDFAWRAIKIARQKAREMGVDVDFRVGNILHLDDLSGPFDLILDIGCYHSLAESDMDIYVENLERLLAPQGTFLMYGFFREPNENSPGMLESGVDKISAHMRLVNRINSTERGLRSSVWLTYVKEDFQASSNMPTEMRENHPRR